MNILGKFWGTGPVPGCLVPGPGSEWGRWTVGVGSGLVGLYLQAPLWANCLLFLGIG